MDFDAKSGRPIRSFSRRNGRMTAAQRKALESLWPVYGLDTADRFRPEATFGRPAPLTVEIGFGNGGSLAEMAENNPDTSFLGIEVHEPGIGHLLHLLAERQIENVRIIRGDAVEILASTIPDESIDRLNLFFPDPWPKKRHHKRRLVTPDFADLAGRKLRAGGCFHIATDWENYALWIEQVLGSCDRFDRLQPSAAALELAGARPRTRFETRGLALGHRVRDLLFVRI